MVHFKKCICAAAALILFFPAAFSADDKPKENEKELEVSANLDKLEAPKKQKDVKIEQSINPNDYPLMATGQFVGMLKDSQQTNHSFTFAGIEDQSGLDLGVNLIYSSYYSTFKDRYVALEFYKENNGKLNYMGAVSFDTRGHSSGTLTSWVPKEDFRDQQYLYMRIGIFGHPSDMYYSAVKTFKVKKVTERSKTRYSIISNESTAENALENTGTFKVNNEQYTFNKKLNPSAYQIDANLPFDVKKHASKKIQPESKSEYSFNKTGDSKSFWVRDFRWDSNYQIQAKLVYSGSKTNVWVHNNQIGSDDARKLGSEFDQKIYPAVTKNFAQVSDVDGNGKIHVLVFDIQDGFSGNGGYIAGYFYGGDLYNIAGSNKSEIFYIDSYPLMGTGSKKDVTAAYETLAHEFQHMVNFNQNVFVENGQPMDTWLNEAFSMAAEQVYTGKALQNRIDYYNISDSITGGHSLLFWDNSGDVLSNYSLSYLFGQYVRVQANKGNAIFKEILNSPYNDYRSVEQVGKKYMGPSVTFGKMMTNFRGALLLKEPTGPYGFKGESSFSTLKPKLFTTSTSKFLRGGGAIARKGEYETVPAFKDENITYTFFDESRLDLTPPSKPIVNAVSDKDSAVTGKAEAGATVYVKNGSAALGSAVAISSQSFSVKINKQKAGTKLSVYAIDPSGNQGPAATVTVQDKTAPAMPSVSSVSDQDKKVTGKAEAGSTVTVKAGSKVLKSGMADSKGNFTITLATAQKAGTVLYVAATDKAGNVSPARKVTVVDKTPPAAPKVNKVTVTSTSVTGKAEASSTVYVKAGKNVIGQAKANKSGSYSVKIKKQKAGTVLYVYAKDKAGNTGKATKTTVKKK
jgi:hypothetical protein